MACNAHGPLPGQADPRPHRHTPQALHAQGRPPGRLQSCQHDGQHQPPHGWRDPRLLGCHCQPHGPSPGSPPPACGLIRLQSLGLEASAPCACLSCGDAEELARLCTVEHCFGTMFEVEAMYTVPLVLKTCQAPCHLWTLSIAVAAPRHPSVPAKLPHTAAFCGLSRFRAPALTFEWQHWAQAQTSLHSFVCCQAQCLLHSQPHSFLSTANR